MKSLHQYYATPAVREQIYRYCGLGGSRETAAVYIKGLGADRLGPAAQWELVGPTPVDMLDGLLDMGADVSRSLWDRYNLLVYLDVDYTNPDFPGEPFTHPAEAFSRLEPLYRVVRLELKRLGLPLLCLITGRGYHFTGRVPLSSPLVEELAALVPDAPSWHAAAAGRAPAWLTDRLDERHARAHEALGLLLEYLAHRLLHHAATRTRIPVVLNGTIVGAGGSGRAAISIDLSFMGDPLDVRHIRVAFGGYQLHRLRADIVGPRISAEVPPMAAIPRGPRAGLLPSLRARQLPHAARLAGRHQVDIPVVSTGVQRLLGAYRGSPLAGFHRIFLQRAREPQDPARLQERVDAAGLPPCVEWPLRQPNDLLLQPAFIQQITRALLASGWAAWEIAALVRNRYESDFGWGDRWTRLDAASRAEFDVRVFAGLAVTGADEAVDFNCVSTQEKGLCPSGGCSLDLTVLRERLLAQVRR